MNKINSPYNWRKLLSIIVVAVGFLSAIIGIYAYFFESKKVNIQYEVIGNTNVLDINANISRLDITYNGNSLKSNKANLKILNLKIINSGSESLLKGYYDLNDPLGVLINNGKIIEMPELVSTSNHYLKKNLKISLDKNGRILFNDLIIEPDQYFTIKILVLHNSVSNPKVIPLGKIAGQNDISVITNDNLRKSKSSFSSAFSGEVIVQCYRVLAYGITFIIILVVIIIIMMAISDYSNKSRRKKLVKMYKKTIPQKSINLGSVIFDIFENEDLHHLKFLFNQTKDEVSLNRKPKSSSFIRDMIDIGLVIQKDNYLSVNKPLRDVLDDFMKFLTTKNYIVNSTNSVNIKYNLEPNTRHLN